MIDHNYSLADKAQVPGNAPQKKKKKEYFRHLGDDPSALARAGLLRDYLIAGLSTPPAEGWDCSPPAHAAPPRRTNHPHHRKNAVYENFAVPHLTKSRPVSCD